MAYLFHSLENYPLRLYGDEAAKGQDIINTLNFYKRCGGPLGKIVIPSLESLARVEEFMIRCFSPTIINPNHNINIEPLPGARFVINANAYLSVKSQIDDYVKLRRGSLYLFDPTNRPELGYYLLPEKVMAALHNHDWKQHEEQIRTWSEDLEQFHLRGERVGFLIRRPKDRS